MSIQVTAATVLVLGKSYNIRCPEHEVNALQKAAKYLEEKMQEIREVNHILSVDRIAVIAALNMTHQLMTIEHEKNVYMQTVNEKLQQLQAKLDEATKLNKNKDTE